MKKEAHKNISIKLFIILLFLFLLCKEGGCTPTTESCDGKDNDRDGLTDEGCLLWSFSTGGGVSSSPAIGDIDGDGKLDVIVGSGDTKVYAIRGDGTLLWSFSTGGFVSSSPAIGDIDGDGKLDVIVGSRDNKVYAIKTGGGVPSDELLPWPKFRRDRYNTGLYGGSAPKFSPPSFSSLSLPPLFPFLFFSFFKLYAFLP